MERLTTNKDVADMGMYELAHNGCYIGEDGAARYRDFETDIDAREFAKALYKRYTKDGDLMSENNDIFDEQVAEDLQYDALYYEQGLIALFYRNLWAMAELREQLKVYEDAEEQGLLVKLPCAIGSDIYYIPSKANYGLNILHHHEEFNRVYHQKIARLHFTENGWYVEGNLNLEYGVVDRIFVDKLYKETWFLTKEEAEQALKQIQVVRKGGVHERYSNRNNDRL